MHENNCCSRFLCLWKRGGEILNWNGDYLWKKLNRGKLIREYIGEGKKEKGFSYAGYRGDLWMFEKAYKDNII